MSKMDKPLTGKTVLLWLIGFFAFVFIANGIMVWVALESWSGLETENAYRKGLAYNEQIREARRQASSGWAITLDQRPTQQTGDTLRITLSVPKGEQVPQTLLVRFIRPTAEGYDHDLILTPQTGHPGVVSYGAPVALPLPGVWDMVILAKSGDEVKYTLKDRLFVQSPSDERQP